MTVPGIRTDPVMGYNFIISLLDTSSTMSTIATAALSFVTDMALGGFNECDGIDMSLEVIDYQEGGNNGTVLKFPTRVSWPAISLKRGVGLTTALWDWHYSFVEGQGKRKDGLIVLLNEMKVPNNIWYFKRGLPIKYSGPTMNAQNNSIAIEQLDIAHEGLYQVPGIGIAAAGAMNIAEAAT